MAELILTEEETQFPLWSDLDDASLGRMVKSFFINHSKPLGDNDADQRRNFAELIHKAALVGMCCLLDRENVGDFECTLHGVTQAGGFEAGDWKIIYRRLTKISNRGRIWLDFATRIFDHIENYTVPQYGDYPDDMLTTMSDRAIIANMTRYVVRAGKGQRGPEEEQRDMLKLIHYASVRYAKLEDKND
jgi:hypothetical protein